MERPWRPVNGSRADYTVAWMLQEQGYTERQSALALEAWSPYASSWSDAADSAERSAARAAKHLVSVQERAPVLQDPDLHAAYDAHRAHVDALVETHGHAVRGAQADYTVALMLQEQGYDEHVALALEAWSPHAGQQDDPTAYAERIAARAAAQRAPEQGPNPAAGADPTSTSDRRDGPGTFVNGVTCTCQPHRCTRRSVSARMAVAPPVKASRSA
jgi:hypothetical protein